MRHRLVAMLREESGGGGGDVVLPDGGVCRDRFANVILMKGVAPIDVHTEQCEADRASEVACHVVEAGSVTCLFA